MEIGYLVIIQLRDKINLNMGFDMKDNVSYIARLYITVLETGDKQKGFCRNGINSKASKGTPDTLRGFFAFKGYSFNRSFLCRLRVDKRIEQRKQALLAPATCTMINERPGWKLGSSPREGMDARGGGVKGSSPFPLTKYGLHKRVMAFFVSCDWTCDECGADMNVEECDCEDEG